MNRSMHAATIAEVFVDDYRIRVSLEMAPSALPSFASVLAADAGPAAPISAPPQDQTDPADIHQPFALRINRQPKVLVPTLVLKEERRRVVRDDLTGEPRRDAIDGTSEPVVVAVLEYALPTKPEILEIGPPTRTAATEPAPEIGLIVQHQGITLNHFVYLREPVEILLDWADPWYSRFRDPRVLRAHPQPVELYLSIVPHEVQLEVVIRPKAAQARIDLGLAGAGHISAEQREAVAAIVSDLVRQMSQVEIDGEPAELVPETMVFVRRALDGVHLLPGDEQLPLDTAILAGVFARALAAPAERLAFRWSFFTDRVKTVPLRLSDGNAVSRHVLSADAATVSWNAGPSTRTLDPPLPEPPAPSTRPLEVPKALLALALLLPLLAWRRPPLAGRVGLITGAVLLTGIITGWSSLQWQPQGHAPQQRPLTEREARLIAERLLDRALKASGYRSEEARRAALNRVVTQGRVDDVLDAMAGRFEATNPFGTRDDIRRVRVAAADFQRPLSSYPLHAHLDVVIWSGVTHWGHVHQHRRHARIDLTIGIEDGRWKIRSLTLQGIQDGLDQRRSSLGAATSSDAADAKPRPFASSPGAEDPPIPRTDPPILGHPQNGSTRAHQ